MLDPQKPGARRDAVRYDDVAVAAASLVKEGQRVTIERLRSAVGGGSYSTLAVHIRRWRETPEGAAAPAGPPDVVVRAVENAWDQLNAAHEAEIQAIRQSADEAMETESRARALAEAEAKRLTAELDSARGELAKLRTALEEKDHLAAEFRLEAAAKQAAHAELLVRTQEQARCLEAAQRAEEASRARLQDLFAQQLAKEQAAQQADEANRKQLQELRTSQAEQERAKVASQQQLERLRLEHEHVCRERDEAVASQQGL